MDNIPQDSSKIAFYFDEMMRRAIAQELRLMGYHVVIANDIGMTQQTDESHLEYATSQNLILVTLDRPFAGRTMSTINHAGLICWTGEYQDVGSIVRALVDFANSHTRENVSGQVFWLK
jgi:uncharacterized protein with PIN domain